MAKTKYKQRADGRYQTSVVVNGKKQYLISNTSNITFKQYAEKWFEVNISIKEEATQNSIKNRMNHIYKYIGNVKLKNLKRYQIQEIQTGMIKDGYTDITNRTIAECRRILEDAVNNDIIDKNVARGIKSIKFPKNERRPLTKDEDIKVVELAKKNKYGLFILVLRFCGLRPEEAVALTIDDVDLDNSQLIINKAVSLAKNRKVPIPDFLMDMLKKEVASKRENGTEYLFTKETDKLSMLTKQALKTHLNSFLIALNKSNKNDEKIKFTYYQLRHSYCTMLYYAGIKIKKAQELMRPFFSRYGI